MTFLTVTDLRNGSSRSGEPGDACWHWLGAMSGDGRPRIWTVDYDRADKRSMSGAKAVFYIAHRCALGDRLAYRCCFTADCVNPDHIRTAADKAEIGRVMTAAGFRRGTSLEQRRANIAKAHAASGCIPTDREIVLAIRKAPPAITGRALSVIHGISQQTVSRIRRCESHREVR